MKKFHWPWQRAREEPVECRHKYKDFPWYVDAHYNYEWSFLNIKIVEPYVCVICGHRIDKILKEFGRDASTERKALEILRAVKNDYSEHVKDQAVVEDMINDMQLVDRKFLEVLGLLDEHQPTPKLKVRKE